METLSGVSFEFTQYGVTGHLKLHDHVSGIRRRVPALHVNCWTVSTRHSGLVTTTQGNSICSSSSSIGGDGSGGRGNDHRECSCLKRDYQSADVDYSHPQSRLPTRSLH